MLIDMRLLKLPDEVFDLHVGEAPVKVSIFATHAGQTKTGIDVEKACASEIHHLIATFHEPLGNGTPSGYCLVEDYCQDLILADFENTSDTHCDEEIRAVLYHGIELFLNSISKT